MKASEARERAKNVDVPDVILQDIYETIIRSSSKGGNRVWYYLERDVIPDYQRWVIKALKNQGYRVVNDEHILEISWTIE